jgi:hypothetical protein
MALLHLLHQRQLPQHPSLHRRQHQRQLHL